MQNDTGSYYPYPVDPNDDTSAMTGMPSAVMPPPTFGLPPNASPPPGNSSRGRMFAIIGAVIALILVSGGIAYAFMRGGVFTQATASDTVKSYCTDLTAQQYSQAYSLFNADTQKLLTQGDYVNAAQALDTIGGKVSACAATSSVLAKDGKSATVTTSLTRAGSKTAQTATFALAQSGTTWRFSQLPDAQLVPLATFTTYCTDLRLNQLPAAFAMESTALQQSYGAVADFESAMQQSVGITGAIAACHPQAVTVAAAGAALQFSIDFSNFQNVPAEAKLVAVSGGTYQVDEFDIGVAGNNVPYPVPGNLISSILQLLQGLLGSNG